MKRTLISIIAVLGIAVVALSVRNAELNKQLKINEAKTERLIIATEEVFKEVEDFVWVNYDVSLSKTLWQGDIYDEWYGAYESIVCF